MPENSKSPYYAEILGKGGSIEKQYIDPDIMAMVCQVGSIKVTVRVQRGSRGHEPSAVEIQFDHDRGTGFLAVQPLSSNLIHIVETRDHS